MQLYTQLSIDVQSPAMSVCIPYGCDVACAVERDDRRAHTAAPTPHPCRASHLLPLPDRVLPFVIAQSGAENL